MSEEVIQLIDTHCHLHRSEFDEDRNEVLKRAQAAGIVALVDPATDFASNAIVTTQSQEVPQLYAAVGIHPHNAQELTPERLKELKTLAGQEKVVAIGEIGLDYYRDLSPRETQREVLKEFLGLAQETNLPVILHCRDEAGAVSGETPFEQSRVYQDLFELLETACKSPIRGLLHCFAGDLKTAQKALEMGLYLSFAGNLTFPKAQALQGVAREVPFDRILLETDAPFLAPQVHRGRRNEPAFLTELAKSWAELSDLTVEDVARTTTVNAYHLFGVGPVPVRGKVTYLIRNSLYVNLTNACTDRCVFCSLSLDAFWKGEGTSPFVKGHHLRMQQDPSADQILAEIPHPERYEEVVFCGYGEPVIRLKTMLEVATQLKNQGVQKIRLNTNGHANLIHRRSVAGELAGLVDEISVSLNTPDAKSYLEICRPSFGLEAYDSIKTFIRECRDAGIQVTATAVAMPGIDLKATRRVAEEELKVQYRERTYNDVG